MNKLKFGVFSVILMLTVSCKHKNMTDVTDTTGEAMSTDSTASVASYALVSIDKNVDYEYRKEILLDSIADIEYVKLERTDDIYIKDIQQLLNAVYLDEKNIFVSTGSNSVLRFNSDGKFLNTIGKKGQGPSEFASLFSFKINSKNNEVYLFDASSKKLLVFDYDGTFKKSIPTKTHAEDFYYQGADTMLLVNRNPAKEPMAFAISESSRDMFDVLLPPHDKKSGMQGFMFDYINKNKIYNGRLILNSEVTDTIFEIDPRTLNVHPKYIQLPSNNGVGEENTSIYLIFETDRFANLAILKDNQVKTTYWYDKLKNEIFTGLIWNEDTQSFVLPINTNIDNKVISLYYAQKLIDLHSKGKIKGKLQELEPDDNPVLMIATFKP